MNVSQKNKSEKPAFLLGAALGTGNLGVSALCHSAVAGLAKRGLTHWVIADFGSGIASPVDSTEQCDWPAGSYERIGISNSRRYYKRNNLQQIALACSVAPGLNPVSSTIRDARIVLSVAGGDSFTDLYGQARFDAVTRPVELAQRMGKQTILLPQTYGPYTNETSLERAANVIRSATLAYARDRDSYAMLKQLAGSSFDPDKHRQGVDMAFTLPTAALNMQWFEQDADMKRVQSWFIQPPPVLVGINISGLLYNDSDAAKTRYKLKADYRQAMHQFIEHLLSQPDVHILLIPHVIPPNDAKQQHPESDTFACQDTLAALRTKCPAARDRVMLAPSLSHPSQVKRIIKQCDWFCGMRMHATIAALSTLTPVAAIAYSMKTAGVFESCGVRDQVADPRELETSQLIDVLIAGFADRLTVTKRIESALPSVLKQAEDQFDHIAMQCDQIGILP